MVFIFILERRLFVRVLSLATGRRRFSFFFLWVVVGAYYPLQINVEGPRFIHGLSRISVNERPSMACTFLLL